MKIFARFNICLFFIAFAITSSANLNDLRHRIQKIIGNRDVAVAIICANGDTLSIRGDEHRELASVAKFFHAAALSHTVTWQTLVSDSVVITQQDLHKNTWSPLRASVDKLPISLTPAVLLDYSLNMSDNNAADIITDRYISPAKAESVIRSVFGISNFALRHNENQMHANPSLSALNYSSAKDAARLIYKFFTSDTIAEATLIKAIMSRDTPFGKDRIPAGIKSSSAKIFHKTGSGFNNEKGQSSTINDLAFISYPRKNGFSCYALAVFVKNFGEHDAEAEKLIADISAEVWNTIIVDEVATMNHQVDNIGLKQHLQEAPYANDEWKEAIFGAVLEAVLNI